MAVTAKIRLTSKSLQNEGTDYEQFLLGFSPDYADDRNKEWALTTPTLSLSMTVKPEVADKFEQGAAYTLTFEKE